MKTIIPNWPAPKNVKAFASTRVGGFSTGSYQGLNLGAHVGDDSSVIEQNRNWLVQQANMPNAPVWLNQTHSTVVAQVSEPTSQVLEADGVFTSSANVICSAMTADCLPVLLTNTQGTQVAAVHAGWRGLANGIVENALEMFSGEVMAWLGPAIGSEAFEVGEDVLQAFMDFDPQAEQAFVPRDIKGKWFADMSKLASQRLNKAGVTLVFDSGLCTYQNQQDFYSYRRDGVTGRQATFIWLGD
ncbi:peptidoglycan editing factor PgeF [Vibrio sp. B1FLJ16]|uniref:peptidoglycan editing factor PgeF n=1 Tax=Vibrio sp. B1FLJ16 TaxID=2751178 RepID=UPI0015F76371|nr:peptidoglycan editing factor PgeF [Vibrio sp. B1FLJ16]EIZ0687394.1 peptidoglycan editing factor PgeF [Vibrio parahaemolyticus]CAD7799757.1 Polyphenol oxidase [Vibrio sp. B1FLJ16]CAD7799772.1 Polyphenol oxidase [Vibrio sp. B1FLJ16]CAE6885986.1 Polyphenol oxidase [Vibrio sp. B1FLJ16]CAE6887042.1 Polyphenol oxidase [Vibrio sp. B1FLJ16]